ncbi:MAG: hypothetical protein P8R04_03125, partial [Gammaproteobacteria bacterium]|nr:hypothetical protein [Gammaproteobacteria bacterium]
MSASPVNLLGLPRRKLEGFFADLNQKPYRARQLMRWIYRDNVFDLDAMTDLSQGLREQLTEKVCFDLPDVTRVQQSKDGTIK